MMLTHIKFLSVLTGLGLVLCIFIGSVSAAPAPIITSTQETMEHNQDSLGLGLTLSLAKRPFVGVPNQTSVLPYFSYQYDRLYIEGLDIGLNLNRQAHFNLQLLATPRFYELKPSFAKNGELDGMDTTQPTYLAGISAQYHRDRLTLTFQALHDVIESQGNEIVLQLGKAYQVSADWSLIPSLGLTYQDAKLVDHFYGVQANEVRSGRSAYAGKSSINYNLTFNGIWRATPRLDLLAQLKYETLGSGITDSPIVNEHAIYFLTLGSVYRF